jgi:hypothetical protein
MKARQFAFLGTIVLALAALSACSDAIYATIETEKKVATNTLPLTLWIQDLAVTPATNTYYVAAGGVFQGVLSGLGGTVSWSPNISDTSRPWNPPGLICNAMALFGGALMADSFQRVAVPHSTELTEPFHLHLVMEL